MRAAGDHRRAEVMRAGHRVREDLRSARVVGRRLENADDSLGLVIQTNDLANHFLIAAEVLHPIFV